MPGDPPPDVPCLICTQHLSAAACSASGKEIAEFWFKRHQGNPLDPQCKEESFGPRASSASSWPTRRAREGSLLPLSPLPPKSNSDHHQPQRKKPELSTSVLLKSPGLGQATVLLCPTLQAGCRNCPVWEIAFGAGLLSASAPKKARKPPPPAATLQGDPMTAPPPTGAQRMLPHSRQEHPKQGPKQPRQGLRKGGSLGHPCFASTHFCQEKGGGDRIRPGVAHWGF